MTNPTSATRRRRRKFPRYAITHATYHDDNKNDVRTTVMCWDLAENRSVYLREWWGADMSFAMNAMEDVIWLFGPDVIVHVVPRSVHLQRCPDCCDCGEWVWYCVAATPARCPRLPAPGLMPLRAADGAIPHEAAVSCRCEHDRSYHIEPRAHRLAHEAISR